MPEGASVTASMHRFVSKEVYNDVYFRKSEADVKERVQYCVDIHTYIPVHLQTHTLTPVYIYTSFRHIVCICVWTDCFSPFVQANKAIPEQGEKSNQRLNFGVK